MVNVIVAWVKKDSIEFEKHVPLKFMSLRNKTLGSNNNFKIVVLEGFNKLSAEYLSDLKTLGNEVLDCSKVYELQSTKFSILDRFGDYEKKCFLRWLVIREVFPNEPIIHYDGDIIFNETPENLERILGKYTFVLQGCPAFVSIKNIDWLNEYYNNLLFFCKDIDKYSADAWAQRTGWEDSYEKKWAGSRWRKIITSDQDLISHLIHTDKLPQEDPSVIKFNSNLVLFENPLYLSSHLKGMFPLTYQRINNVDYFNDRKIAFWHMQYNFVDYLAFYIQRGFLNKIFRCSNPLEHKSIDYFFIKLLRRALLGKLNRLDVYKYFFEESDFSHLFREKVFWQKNIF